MSVNRIVNGWCSTCLRPADKEHQNCVVRCHKCQQEGHRLAECTAKVTGSSENNSQNCANKSKGHNGKPHSEKKRAIVAAIRPMCSQLTGRLGPLPLEEHRGRQPPNINRSLGGELTTLVCNTSTPVMVSAI